MISTDRQHQLVYSISLLKQVRFLTTEQDLSLATRFMLSSLEPIKCMPFSRESVPKFGTLFLIRLKYLNVRPFVKKIKELLQNFLRSKDDYVEVSRIKLLNTLGQPLFVIVTYLPCFMLVYSIYCIVLSSLLFSPSIDKPCTCNMSSALPASISL